MKNAFFWAMILTVFPWNPVFGQTADGQTPAEESVCDMAGYTGALWGLCNAYCEAMDCDNKSVDARDEACERVLSSFIAKGGGKGLPCTIFGKRCTEQCKLDLKADYNTCDKQYEMAAKACGNDIECINDAKLNYTYCQSDAEVNYGLCAARCVGNDCAAECFELRIKADDKCYNKYCNDNFCDDKSLGACLYHNEVLEGKCLSGCDDIIIK